MAEFRDRARHEARRYGEDQWVFVRELLQNSRDAFASRVEITVDTADGADRISFADNGVGMSFDEAKRFLFTLYASDKAGDPGSAGNFGVGFWSVLRFEPSTVVIRSRPRDGSGWQARLSGSLDEVEVGDAALIEGTEVVLERPHRGEDVLAAVRRSVHDDAGFISARRRGNHALEIVVNGQRCERDFALPPPSLSFERRGLRGVVALAGEPRVDLFAHGLRVRTASDLSDLTLGDDGPRARQPEGLSAEGAAASVLLDSARLEVLLSRGDAREGPVLRRMVRLARKELDRLVQSELDRVAPGSWWQRASEWLYGLWSLKWMRFAALVIVAGAALGLIAAEAYEWYRPSAQRAPSRSPKPLASAQILSPPEGDASAPSLRRFGAGGLVYAGPVIDVLGRSPIPVDLAYRPGREQPYFALLRIDGMSAAGEVVSATDGLSQSLTSDSCARECIDVELGIDSDAGVIVLPVPSGYAVERPSARLDDEPVEVVLAPGDGVAIRLSRPSRGKLSYRVGLVERHSASTVGSWPELPPELGVFSAGLRGKPFDEIVAESVQRVAELVAYDRSAASAGRLRSARAEGLGYFTAVLGVGAGDCDVQCSVLAGVLSAAGVPARMAVGFVGEDGSVRPGLHAWVEAFDGAGRLRVVEVFAASSVAVAAPSSGARPVRADPGGVGVLARLSGAAVAALLTAAGLAFAAAVAGCARPRTRRRFVRGDGESLKEMVRGSLCGSPALAHIRALRRRPLVPLLGARATSLQRALELARDGRLFCSREHGVLAETAASSGRAVVDNGHAVGGVVCELLGAQNLDHWQDLLATGETTEVTKRVDEALARQGINWRLRLVVGSTDDVTFLDLGREQVVAVERDSELCTASRNAAHDSAQRAAFILADGVLHRLGAEERESAAALTELARTAVFEAGPPPRDAPEADDAR